MNGAYATIQLAGLLAADVAPLHDAIDRWLLGIPIAWARYVVVAMFALAAVWVLSLKRDYVYLGAPDTRRWRDLRLWTVVFLIPYIVVYLVL